MKFPLVIQQLINAFSHFPSVGPKTAERYVFYLLKQDPEILNKLAQNIADLKKNIVVCQQCFALAENNPCSICSNKNRNKKQLCIVASTREMLAIEDLNIYQGHYHVLGKIIDVVNENNFQKLSLAKLINKIKENNVEEIIIALSPDLAGETTAMYLTKILKQFNLKITRLAQGLPSGASVEYADQSTLTNALKFRNKIN